MSTDTFEARAEAAGAALRAAFVTAGRPGTRPAGTSQGGSSMSTVTPSTPVQPELQPLPLRPRRRPAAWAAAAGLVIAAGTAGVVVLTADEGPGDRLTPAAPAVVLRGLPERPDFPITMEVPETLRSFATYDGYHAFETVGPPPDSAESAYVVVAALHSFDGVVAADLPSDISSLLADREDVAVSDVAEKRVLGRPAQTFTLTTRTGQQPRPVWCASPSGDCWFPLPSAVVDVSLIPTSAGPLVVLMEADPEGQAAGKAALQELLDGMQLS